MTGLVSRFLKRASTRTLLLVSIATLGVAGAALALLPISELRPITHILALLLGTGVVAAGIAAVQGARTWVRRIPEDQRFDRAATLALGLAAVLGLTAFVVWSNGFYWKTTRDLCWRAQQAESLEARRRALDEGRARLKSPFSWLPELTGFRVSEICAGAGEDLQKLDHGECPTFPIRSIPCSCGSERWPADARCEHAQCARYASPPRLNCYGDPW